ncbi:hypothetical protein HOY82DRAFT_74007 [Tuber indicum]|nr:hypothetical protein HOY82DRAFT_74007 [Tuber indicum]
MNGDMAILFLQTIFTTSNCSSGWFPFSFFPLLFSFLLSFIHFPTLLLMNCFSTRSLNLRYIVLNLWYLLYSLKAVLFPKPFLPEHCGIPYRHPFPARSTCDPVLECAFFGFGDCRQRSPRRKNVCGTTCRSCQLRRTVYTRQDR